MSSYLSLCSMAKQSTTTTTATLNLVYCTTARLLMVSYVVIEIPWARFLHSPTCTVDTFSKSSSIPACSLFVEEG